MRRLLLIVGIGLVGCGVGLAAFVGFQAFGTGAETERAQDGLRQQWADGPAQPQPGPQPRERQDSPRGERSEVPDGSPWRGGVAVLRIPRLGESDGWVVVEGVDEDDLKRGPGHYPGTALPGEPGNFAVAGHRAGYGEPFAELERVRSGDRVLVETRRAWHVYRVRRTRVTTPDRTDLIAAVPGRPGARPDGAYLTLTTCHPRWSTAERLVVTAELVRSGPDRAGPPNGV